jgi:protein tyrosine phosphatase (PTP) superfamily phosphohydrolase (DUF442 family)
MRMARRQRRAVKRGYRDLRQKLIAGTPTRLRGPFAHVMEHFDLIAVDHGVFRALYLNRHKVDDEVWRSAQPAPHHLRKFARLGVRTVINLRGPRDCGSYRLERQVCAQLGLRLVDFKMQSRGVPLPETVHAAKALFESVEYPILMHCKSGADRVGLMSALYLILRAGRPLEEAAGQLSLRYGHFRQADTGVLDYFLESYRAFDAVTPTAFLDWVDRIYDPVAMKAEFRASAGLNLLVNRVLRRE